MAREDCLKGVIIGGLIGAVLGVLYAPKSGKETRRQICGLTEDVLQKAKEQYEDAMRKIENLADKEKEMIIEKKDRLKNALEAGVEAFRQEKQEEDI